VNHARRQLVYLDSASKCNLYFTQPMNSQDFICAGGRMTGTENVGTGVGFRLGGRVHLEAHYEIKGDGGGPLMVRDAPTKRWFQVGVTSYGTHSADAQSQFDVGAYARIDCDWLEKATRGAVKCTDTVPVRDYNDK
jgi:hypothetical protein